MRLSGGLARWPPPAPRAVSQPTPLVYVVMRRAAEGPWRQLYKPKLSLQGPDETWLAHDTNTSKSDEHKMDAERNISYTSKGSCHWRNCLGTSNCTWSIPSNLGGGCGGLKGNLFTDSTRVTLSLWPDTIYHIQVELVSRTLGVDNEKSENYEQLIQVVHSVFSTESVQDVEVSEGDRLMSVLVSSMRGERVPERAPRF
ncbi:unnamed protein product [Danaus chrysippus]|uniref:(African queen) hypothetical protein n=1 Tax=Danaus chrysippus TaxID=151541 RepID=A0A8J2RHY5_9NEOP|nr:unnamed protein product [Danaus chrysippus]